MARTCVTVPNFSVFLMTFEDGTQHPPLLFVLAVFCRFVKSQQASQTPPWPVWLFSPVPPHVLSKLTSGLERLFTPRTGSLDVKKQKTAAVIKSCNKKTFSTTILGRAQRAVSSAQQKLKAFCWVVYTSTMAIWT